MNRAISAEEISKTQSAPKRGTYSDAGELLAFYRMSPESDWGYFYDARGVAFGATIEGVAMLDPDLAAMELISNARKGGE